MRERIVLQHTKEGVQFWDGRRWIREYPDAQIFKTLNTAISACVRIPGTCAPAVIANYGQADQECEWA